MKFDSKELDWRVIYALPRKVTTNTYRFNKDTEQNSLSE